MADLDQLVDTVVCFSSLRREDAAVVVGKHGSDSGIDRM